MVKHFMNEDYEDSYIESKSKLIAGTLETKTSLTVAFTFSSSGNLDIHFASIHKNMLSQSSGNAVYLVFNDSIVEKLLVTKDKVSQLTSSGNSWIIFNSFPINKNIADKLRYIGLKSVKVGITEYAVNKSGNKKLIALLNCINKKKSAL